MWWRGAPHTAKISYINLCVEVPPAAVYKGSRGGGQPASMARQGGVLLLVGVGLLLGGGKKWGGRGEGGRCPPLLVQFRLGGRRRTAHHWLPLSLSTKAHMAHYFSRGVPVTLRHTGFLREHPEHFRCLNIVVQYINLYVSTISRLLVMSVITSGTPTNLGYIKMHKLITVIVTLSVRTLRVREQCRHDRDTFPVNNQ